MKQLFFKNHELFGHPRILKWVGVAKGTLGMICLFTWCNLFGTSNAQIEQLDAQIKELKEMKRGYEARAIRAENQADRLQFEDHFVLETRRFYRIADENRAKAAKIQEEIDRLEAQKANLLK